MIPILVATITWQNDLAKTLLDSVTAHYKEAKAFSCKIEYSCTRTPTGKRVGTSDSMSLLFEMREDTYTVRPLSRSLAGVFRAGRQQASVDPFLVFDHHLTFWLGFRATSLTRMLVPKDATGPRYSQFQVSPTKVAVYETYIDKSAVPFQITYAIDPVARKIMSVSVCGYLSSISTDDDSKTLWSEFVEVIDQKFGR